MLCEGDDDKGVFEAIISKRGLPEFQVCHAHECGGIGGRGGFAKALAGIEAISGFGSVRGFLLVTDNDVLNASFKEAQQALLDNGHTPPADPMGIGRIAGRPVAILMIPHREVVGDLETLCLPAVHDKWPTAENCVRAFLDCTGASAWRKRSSLSKARARAAAVGFNEPDPYKGIGHLFRNDTLSAMHPCFDEISEFISTLAARMGI
jgi:hypothetical protein